MRYYTFVSAAFLMFVPTFASAHAFGAQYTLPLPATFYVIGGSLALILSFLLLLISPPKTGDTIPKSDYCIISAQKTRWLIRALRFLSIALLFLTVVIGLFGSKNPFLNFAPLSFWIFFLLGFAYVSVFVRGLWDEINPFAVGVSSSSAVLPRYTFSRWARYVPALILYVFIIWVELLSGSFAAYPFYIALALIAYILFSHAVIALYGRDVWREYFDVFGVFFRTIGVLAPITVSKEGIFLHRASAARASQEKANSVWLIVFILSVLAFTAFDGYRETLPYVDALIRYSNVIQPQVFELMIFALFPVAFLSIYVICVYCVKVIAHVSAPLADIVRLYAYSLVPIAVVYHFAHYFTLLFTEGQRIIILISDPFGVGANIFGTRGYQVNPAVIGPDVIWYVQLAVIVLGHIIALYLSHIITYRLAPTRLRAQLAELPLVAVMVFYTAFGLWILSRPFAL